MQEIQIQPVFQTYVGVYTYISYLIPEDVALARDFSLAMIVCRMPAVAGGRSIGGGGGGGGSRYTRL